MKIKNCTNCELFIVIKCCGRNDIYGKEITTPIENCEAWEISFSCLQNEESTVDATLEKLLGIE